MFILGGSARLARFNVERSLIVDVKEIVSGGPSALEACNGCRFAWTRFKNWQQSGNFQCVLQVRPQVTEFEVSARGFCFSMKFDERAEAGAVHVIDVLEVGNNACGAGCEKGLDRGTQTDTFFTEHETTFERQNIDSARLTLCNFQRHGCWPPTGNCVTSMIAFRMALQKVHR